MIDMYGPYERGFICVPDLCVCVCVCVCVKQILGFKEPEVLLHINSIVTTYGLLLLSYFVAISTRGGARVNRGQRYLGAQGVAPPGGGSGGRAPW